jgi:hypothetical protein
MPLQNRVDPYGRLQAVAARGALMGNRGILHDEEKQIVAAWRSPRWITCSLRFKDRRREVFAPRRYSELFFLDEATSLAAGHRPCAECRRARFQEFCGAWTAGNGGRATSQPKADAIDRALHSERVGQGGGKNTYPAKLASLPPGTLVEHEGRPHVYWSGALRSWTFEGYGAPADISSATEVRVLTPKSIVRVIQAGFAPQVHETASG